MNDHDLQKELLEKIQELRRLNDSVAETAIRQTVSEYLTRAFLIVRDGNLEKMNGGAGPNKELE